MTRLNTSFVLGYHGCEEALGVSAINGEISLLQSTRNFDWLGAGIYFWEGDPQRAREWAESKRARGDYKNPFVIGAVIDLGHCLDLQVRENCELVRSAFNSFKAVQEKGGFTLPVNKAAPKDSSPDLVMRYLDCAVLNHLHAIIEESHVQPFDSVRAVFVEGGPLFEGTRIYDKTHSQIAVRNSKCIKGIFRPL